MAIYPCLASGGTLNLVDKNMINKPKLLNEMLTATPINIWVSTPSFMEMCFYYQRLMKNSMVVLTNSSSVAKSYLTEQQKR